MPILTIHAHKGGQGVTTIAAALATLTAQAQHRTLLIDTGHDLAAVLGINEPDTPGLGNYLTPTNHITLADITTTITDHLDLINLGDTNPTFDTSTYGLITGALDHYDTVIIDTSPAAHRWTRHADHTLLVTRPCYLALRHATGKVPRPDHLVVITEPGRALNTADIEAVTGTPVTATIPHDTAIARAIDAGLLTTRLPRTLTRALRPLAHAIATATTATTDEVAR